MVGTAHTIWRYAVKLGRFEYEMPEGSVPISVDVQSMNLTGQVASMWVMVTDHDAPMERRRFQTVTTGADVPEPSEYIGTFVAEDGWHVGHVFELSGKEH